MRQSVPRKKPPAPHCHYALLVYYCHLCLLLIEIRCKNQVEGLCSQSSHAS